MLQASGFCFGIGYLACIQALAYPMPSLEQTIIFNHVPTDVDAPVIAEVTIIDMTPDLRDLHAFTGRWP